MGYNNTIDEFSTSSTENQHYRSSKILLLRKMSREMTIAGRPKKLGKSEAELRQVFYVTPFYYTLTDLAHLKRKRNPTFSQLSYQNNLECTRSI
ncbi:hypothetical protein EUGRSUZ_G02413 [Eucalyptus grandis]|uniref:Uncharacterized protein n=2 Tax=Eucalyptus grandis TaxID=71139 RepID=A0ACC3K6D6_EUCGR|nr:hypothetical protein EUGRSUZ_G02413 [Eucalyptus grandis]